MIRVLAFIVVICLLEVTVAQEYNQERYGFGSATTYPAADPNQIPDINVTNSHEPRPLNASTLQQHQLPAVNNITYYTAIQASPSNNSDVIESSTITSRQSDSPYFGDNYQQQPLGANLNNNDFYQPQNQQQFYSPQQSQQQQQQQLIYPSQNQGCTLAGCTPPHVNERQYEANAQQYSYATVNFNQPQQQEQYSQDFNNQQPQQYNEPNQQIYGNPSSTNSNQNFPPQGYQNQPLQDQGSQFGNAGFVGQQQQFGENSENGNLQQITITNLDNTSFPQPVAERLTITKYPNGTLVNVEKTQPSQQSSSNFISGPGLVPNQQNQGQNPSSVIITGSNFGPGNPSLNQQYQPQNNNNNFGPTNNQQQYPNIIGPNGQPLTPDYSQQYDQGQYSYMGVNQLNGNGGQTITTGGVVMAPDNSGVPLLVSPDYLFNNFQTGQVKIIDASYSPSQGFMDYQTFQMRQYYGNFAALRTQFVNYDYNSAHILNAVYFNFDIATYPTRNQRYTLYPPGLFQQYVQSLGINQNDYIVVYSRDSLGGMQYAAAVWELFRIYNHSRISVLNGGLNAWVSAGYETTADIVSPRPGNWRAAFDAMKVITFEEMVAIQPNGKCYFQETGLFNFLDTRSRLDYQQNGRLFGSKNFPINEIIQPNGMIMSADDINIALARANYTRGQTSFVMGTNGPDAAFGVLALAVVGDLRARLYNVRGLILKETKSKVVAKRQREEYMKSIKDLLTFSSGNPKLWQYA